MVGRVLAICVLTAGCVLVVFGTALVLNVLSLRELAEWTRLPPVVGAVFEVRDELSHRRAQWIEAVVGVVGLAMASAAAWRLHGRGPGIDHRGG